MSFINEHGEEEAGIDGGGIFKDFMENITRAAFDVQYGLFKVSAFFPLKHAGELCIISLRIVVVVVQRAGQRRSLP